MKNIYLYFFTFFYSSILASTNFNFASTDFNEATSILSHSKGSVQFSQEPTYSSYSIENEDQSSTADDSSAVKLQADKIQSHDGSYNQDSMLKADVLCTTLSGPLPVSLPESLDTPLPVSLDLAGNTHAKGFSLIKRRSSLKKLKDANSQYSSTSSLSDIHVPIKKHLLYQMLRASTIEQQKNYPNTVQQCISYTTCTRTDSDSLNPVGSSFLTLIACAYGHHNKPYQIRHALKDRKIASTISCEEIITHMIGINKSILVENKLISEDNEDIEGQNCAIEEENAYLYKNNQAIYNDNDALLHYERLLIESGCASGYEVELTPYFDYIPKIPLLDPKPLVFPDLYSLDNPNGTHIRETGSSQITIYDKHYRKMVDFKEDDEKIYNLLDSRLKKEQSLTQISLDEINFLNSNNLFLVVKLSEYRPCS